MFDIEGDQWWGKGKDWWQDIYRLRANCQKIHYFGLGFIQLKVTDDIRLHFYAPEYTATVSEEDVHNHRYNFTSTILKGTFHQEFFRVILCGESTHVQERESCKEGVEALGDRYPCDLMRLSSHVYTAGCEYFIHHEVFHRVWATNCITMIHRGKPVKDYADVVRRKDAPKICPFSVKVPEGELWSVVERMLKE